MHYCVIHSSTTINSTNQQPRMSSVIVCVLCLERVLEIVNACDGGHVLCTGCSSIFEGCPACNNFNRKASTVAKGDSKISAITVVDSDDDEDLKRAIEESKSVGTKRKADMVVLDSDIDDEDDKFSCIKCKEALDEDDDFTTFECTKRHVACGACLQLLDECPVCDGPKLKQTKTCNCVVCIAENVLCDAEIDGRPCITCSSLRVNCVFEK